MLENPRCKHVLTLLDLDTSEVEQVFRLLDDGDGNITWDTAVAIAAIARSFFIFGKYVIAVMPCTIHLVTRLFLCWPGARLGKMIVFSTKWYRKRICVLVPVLGLAGTFHDIRHNLD